MITLSGLLCGRCNGVEPPSFKARSSLRTPKVACAIWSARARRVAEQLDRALKCAGGAMVQRVLLSVFVLKRCRAAIAGLRPTALQDCVGLFFFRWPLGEDDAVKAVVSGG